MLPESWMVIKKNGNPNNVFYLRFTKEVKGVPLHFGKEEVESLKKLELFPRKPVFIYLNESTNAATFYSRLAMLIIALEGIAGEKSPNVTDKDYIKNRILKDNQLFNEIFAFGNGIRNKIFHGKDVNITKNYIDKIYKKIIEYFNSEFNTKISLDVKHPQRTPWGNYREVKGFFRSKISAVVDFKEIIKKFDESITTNRPIPDGYEYLAKIENY